jgi:hypothetical protein
VSGPDFSSQRSSRTPRAGALLLGVGAFFALWSVWGAYAATAARSAARASLVRTESQAPLSPRAQRNGPEPILAAAAQLEQAIQHSPASIVAALAAELPRDARFTRIAIVYAAGSHLDLGVTATRPEAYDAVLEQLARRTEIEQVLPGGESRGAEVDGRVRASLRAAK